jgi:hypothetical protein
MRPRIAGNANPRLRTTRRRGFRSRELESALPLRGGLRVRCVLHVCARDSACRRDIAGRVANGEAVEARLRIRLSRGGHRGMRETGGNEKGVASWCADGEWPCGAGVGRDSRTEERIWGERTFVKRGGGTSWVAGPHM